MSRTQNDISEDMSSESLALPVEETWLTELLSSKCSAMGVLDSYVCRGIAEGKGFLSFITRVHLNWNQEESRDLELLPTDIVIKRPTMEKVHALDEKLKDVFHVEKLIDFHNRECRAYEFFNKYSPPPIPMARLFYAEEMTDTGRNGMLILEDITDQAISLGFVDDVSLDQIYEMADHVASLQAYGLNNPDTADYIIPMVDDPFEELFKDFESSLDQTRSEYPEILKWTNDELKELLAKRQRICSMFSKPKDFPTTQVVALGDVQPNNILWHRSGLDNDRPSSRVAAFIDFQLSHLGNCMIDIANMMTMGLPTGVRRTNTDSVIRRYLTQLNAKTHSGAAVTLAECKRLQLEMMFQFAAMGLCNYPMLTTIIRMDKERKDILLHRLIGCIDDALAGLEQI